MSNTKGYGVSNIYPYRKQQFVNRWGKIKQINIPNAIFQNNSLSLSPAAIGVLLALLQVHKAKVHRKDESSTASVGIGHRKLAERTGFSKNVITKAVKELTMSKFILPQENRRRKYGEFGVNEYVLCDPRSGEPLENLSNIYHAKKLSYFTMPQCIVTEQTAHWSLANLAGREIKLYMAILSLANRHDTHDFSTKPLELRKMSDLTKATFNEAIKGLEERGLVWASANRERIEVCDPYLGAPLYDPREDEYDDEADPANYFITRQNKRSGRLNLNVGNSEHVRALILSSLAADEAMIPQGNSDLLIRCPFHEDNNPSCSVSPSKNGCFKCFGCGEKGGLRKLLMRLRGIGSADAIKTMSTAFGMEASYREPDKGAIKYDYRNQYGKLIKQVLRFPNDENGNKVFRQRRPGGQGEWIWDTQGVTPTLYNMDWLKSAMLVAITEGEKDAKTMTDLKLFSRFGHIIGVTSGGADTWDDSLAEHLRNMIHVIVMPDADAPGEKFAVNVKRSLESRGIAHSVVTFGDVGAKDITEFLEEHTVSELMSRIGAEWFPEKEQSAKRENTLSPSELFEMAENMEGIMVP